jgi:hypothetical protein
MSPVYTNIHLFIFWSVHFKNFISQQIELVWVMKLQMQHNKIKYSYWSTGIFCNKFPENKGVRQGYLNGKAIPNGKAGMVQVLKLPFLRRRYSCSAAGWRHEMESNYRNTTEAQIIEQARFSIEDIAHVGWILPHKIKSLQQSYCVISGNSALDSM